MSTAAARAESRTYRTIDRFPGYRFGSDGSVWTRLERRGSLAYQPVGEWRPMTLTLNSRGYRTVSLQSTTGLKRCQSVHRLILEAFEGPCPAGMEACHNNGIRGDNRIANLRWDTRRSNHADKRIHGTHSAGERSPKSKLTNAEALEIKTRYSNGGVSQPALAREYGVSQPTIWNIIHGVSYGGSA